MSTEGFRLSPQQRHLWAVQQRGQASDYHTQSATLIAGPLDVPALARALQHAVDRHEILRTTFQQVPGMIFPVQVVAARHATALVQHDLRGQDEQAQRERVAALLAGMRQLPPAAGSLLQCTLAQLADARWALLLDLPGLCADAAGMQLLVREVSRAYTAQLAGAALDDEPMQYADLAEWLNEVLEAEEPPAALLGQIAGLLAHRLPCERTPQANAAPRRVAVPLPDGLLPQIEQLAQAQGTSPATCLLACWQALLWRLSGQPELVVGTAFDGRNYAELEQAIGLVERSLPVTGRLHAAMPFTALLLHIHAAAQELGERQETLIWERIAPGLAADSGFAWGFAWQELPAAWAEAGLTWQIEHLDACVDHQGVRLVCTRDGGRLSAALHYDGGRLADDDTVRLAAQLAALLDDAIGRPDAALGSLHMLSPAERDLLLVAYNDTARTWPAPVSVQRRFAQQVARTPGHVAVVHEERQLTYAELDARTNQLAHALRRCGVGPETLVPLCVERSLDMIIGMLGILKAGAAYVPLEPSLPPAYRRHILADSRAALVVAQRHLVADVAGSAQLLCLDADAAQIAREPTEPPPVADDLEQLAYVLYTSGSTGLPKGVMVAHRQLANYLDGILERLDGRSRDFALLSTFAADLGNTVIFPALCTGGCLHIIDAARLADGGQLAEYYRRRPIDCMKIVPAHLAALLACPTPQDVLPRRQLVLGGAAAPWSLVERVQQLAPECQITNHYGPTETTVGVLTYQLAHDECRAATVPLGRPLANTQVYILDAQLQPVPTWAVGQIAIGGAGLARGYHGRPDLTAERFVPNPFAASPGGMPDFQHEEHEGFEDLADHTTQHPSALDNQPASQHHAAQPTSLQPPASSLWHGLQPPAPSLWHGLRLYLTGDQGRWLPDGTIEFLGRADDQVKLRGFRVELGGIEAVLRQHPAVRDAAVIARQDGDDVMLAAYVVPLEDAAPARLADTLRDFLRERLPDYMLPAALVPLAALPLTPNGKVDRAALPAPATGQDQAFVAPRTPTETLLAAIWCDVLRREQIGASDHFFALGGHSLLATQVTSRIRTTFAVDLPVRTLFEAPTLAALASRIDAASAAPPSAEAPLLPTGRTDDLPLSFAQQRLWFLAQLVADSPFYHLPVAVRLTGELAVSALTDSLNALVARHAVLRTCFVVRDGEPLQQVLPQRHVPLPLVDLAGLPQAEQDAAMDQQLRAAIQQPFDLARGPLLRAQLLRLAPTQHVLLLSMHHIVSDGWSTGVLVRELGALYQAGLRGAPPELPALSIQYGDFAVWQRGHLQGATLERQLDFWRAQLAGAPPVLELPTDHPRPAAQSFWAAYHTLAIGPELTAALRRLGQQADATLFMTLLAAFQVLLARWSGQDDLLVGTPIAGRTRSELEPLIGCFVNTLVIRSDLSGNPTFLELLRQVRATTLDAYAHQDLPFEKLVEALRLERGLRHSPLFQVLFVFGNTPTTPFAVPGLALEPLEVGNQMVQFDLSLSLVESGDGLAGTLAYNRDLFTPATIARAAERLELLLAGAAATPQARILDLPLLPAAERRLLAAWSHGPASAAPAWCAHHLFERQAAVAPDRVAVVLDAQQLSYAALNRRANRLAHQLLAHGVGPETPVGLCVERSLDLVVGVLGVLKAGAAYVPLDPLYPRERLTFMLQDSRAPVLVAQRRGAADWMDLPTVWLDDDWPQIGQLPADNPPVPVAPDNLAYVIYTSGSTGRPKGTLITHRGLCNVVQATIAAFDIQPAARVLQFASLSFDASIWQLCMGLLAGATLHLVGAETVRSAAGLAQLLERHCVEVADLPPVMLDLLPVHPYSALRTLSTGGERCTVERATRWAVGRRFFNVYGPTETAVATAWQLVAPPAPDTHAIPIGHPIANTAIYLLDRRLQPVPIGTPGELYIAGCGLARGYLNQPELTAERFVPNPFAAAHTSAWVVQHEAHEGYEEHEGFSNQPNQDRLALANHPATQDQAAESTSLKPLASSPRLYHTGDLARYLPDGAIEFLGRGDQQVKIRGFRIELDEIAAVLRQHPAVAEALVLAREEPSGTRQLVAYVVPRAADSAALDLPPLPASEQRPRHTLPNGLEILHQGALQANVMYDEIFHQQVYLRHGITLRAGDCVFDVGANIGLFSLFAHQHAPGARVYAFEPIPQTFSLLQANIRRAGLRSVAVPCGLSDTQTTATFTFYPQMGGMSGRFADLEADKQVLRGRLGALRQHGAGAALPDEAAIEAVLDEYFFQHETTSCPLRRLSDVIAEHGVSQIDLLKIDAEKSELDILLGIDQGDWPKIRQIVMEVHSRDLLDQVLELLARQGYDTHADLPTGTGQPWSGQPAMLYARRDGRLAPDSGSQDAGQVLPAPSGDELRLALQARLPDYMLPAAFVLLAAMPRLPNRKIDLQALPVPAVGQSQAFIAPRTPTEAVLAAIWAEVLGQERVGIHDNFFALGGHSLLATQLIARVRSTLGVDLPLRSLFELPTVAELAQAVQPHAPAWQDDALDQLLDELEALPEDDPAT